MQDTWEQILEYVVRYPSWFNTQPVVFSLAEGRLEVFVDTTRLIEGQATSDLYAWMAVGMAVESAKIAAASLGYVLVEDLDALASDSAGARYRHVGSLALAPSHGEVVDLDPELLHRRRTSRLPYSTQTVPHLVVSQMADQVERLGYRLRDSDDPGLIQAVLRLSQEAQLADLADPFRRRQLQRFLRYTKAQARRTRDGVSAESLNLPPVLMRLMVGHHLPHRLPVLGRLVRAGYSDAIGSAAHVGWITGRCANATDAMKAGRAMLRAWLVLADHRLYLQPFGQLLARPHSYSQLIGVLPEVPEGERVCMIFRMGHTKTPPVSYRRSLEDFLISGS